jgi:hypothetical protein
LLTGIAMNWYLKCPEKKKNTRLFGFKNNAGGYELRNEYFKGSSSPKYVSYLDNKADTIKVFEGFFDLLTFQSMHQNEQNDPANLLVFNSLSFFERSLLLMEKHQSIDLYLENANRYIVYQVILETLPHCRSLDDLERKLQKQNIETLYKYKSHSTKLQGISFRIGYFKYKGSLFVSGNIFKLPL